LSWKDSGTLNLGGEHIECSARASSRAPADRRGVMLVEIDTTQAR
jgi:hypothetical protein